MNTHYTNVPAYETSDGGRPWKPGIGARMPWLGLGALLVSILGVAASVGILVTSNGNSISAWKFQPNTYLSIASTITNITLHFALSEGVTIAWWRRATKPGTKLGDLHRYWDFGNSLWASMKSGRRFNLIALACILTALAPINGPLLQRASTVTIASVASVRPLQVSLATTLDITTAYLSGRAYSVSLVAPEFSPIMQNYYNGGDVHMNETGCSSGGKCAARVRGAGFAVNCSSYTAPFSVIPGANVPNGAYNVSEDPAVINGTYVFMSYFSWTAYTPKRIQLNIQYKNTSDCAGNLVVWNCTLISTTVGYPVIVDGNKSTIALDPHSTIFDDVVEAPPNATSGMAEQGPSVFGGFWFALNNKLASTLHMRFAGAVSYEIISTGSIASQYAIVKGASNSSEAYGIATGCSVHFRDPTNDLLEEARKFMFQTAVSSANSSDLQHVSSTETATHAVYQSHYEFLAIAGALTVLAIFLVTLTFGGYWHLGRPMTLSPIELAKAFNAPLLRNEDSNAKVTGLVRKVGERAVRYGAVTSGFELDEAAKNYTHVTISSFNPGAHRQNVRLEIADEAMVGQPQRGWKFTG